MKASVIRTRPQAQAGLAQSDNAFRALIRSFGLLKRIMEPYIARFGISGSQWGVLRTLHRSEEEGLRALRLTDLGDRLLVRPPSVTRVVDRLHRMGLVRRSASSVDQRAKLVKLTPGGQRLVRRVLRGHSAQVEDVLSALSAADQERLRSLLDRLSFHLHSMAERSGGDGRR